jgi:glycosyltransferase involved in cell wall biosynthesis
MLSFKNEGHQIFSLSQAEGHHIHDFLKSKDVNVFSYTLGGKKNVWYYLRHLIFFVKFCHRYKINIVYSHLESANFVASVGQFLIKAKVFLCRHHVNEANLYQFDRNVYYRLTNALAKKILVVSQQAKDYMIKFEKVRASKILHINLAYDFSLYAPPDNVLVNGLRQSMQCDLLLISVGRLTKFKRPDISVDVLHALVEKNFNAKLIVLGKGELENELKDKIQFLGLTESVIFPGHVPNVLDYLAASDFLVHPSLLESSCVVVKEAGLVKLPVVVSQGIGDFDDYLIHRSNAFVVDRENFAHECTTLIMEHINKHDQRKLLGENLNRDVYRLFSITKIIEQYRKLMYASD